jgi:hypothetical protein
MTKDDVENVIDFTVKEITSSFARRWENEAKLNLHQTRERYINNLIVVDTGRMSGAVVLDYSKDKMIQMIEEGASAFDMKDGFEKSNKKHTKKGGGWYLTIPFRWATPGAIAESSVFTATMPQQVYSAVKSAPQNIPTSSGGTRSAGLSLNNIPDRFKAPSTRAGFSNLLTSKTFESYEQKTSVYAGISKMSDATTGQNTYMSFRRVSDKSDPSSWIHPGMEAQNLAQKALDKLEVNIESEMGRALDMALANYGF